MIYARERASSNRACLYFLESYAATLALDRIGWKSEASRSRTLNPISKFQQLTMASLNPPGGIECSSGGLSS